MTSSSHGHPRQSPPSNGLPLALRVRTWQRAQALLWCGAFAGMVLTSEPPGWLPAAAALVALAAYAALFAAVSARRAADVVTLCRVAALAAVACAVGRAGAIETWHVVVAAVVVALDLVDGAVARRTGATAAGAVLDMEADQTATLTLAILALEPGGLAVWALALPGFRYAFVLLSWRLALPAHDPKPKAGDNRRARHICAAVVTLQLAALLPVLPASVRSACLAVAVAALAYSYSDDLVFLLRRRPTARA